MHFKCAFLILPTYVNFDAAAEGTSVIGDPDARDNKFRSTHPSEVKSRSSMNHIFRAIGYQKKNTFEAWR